MPLFNQYLSQLPLDHCYRLWDAFADIPVATGDGELPADSIEAPFLHFGVGTAREDIWRWFEARNPDFVVGDVLQGHRRETALAE